MNHFFRIYFLGTYQNNCFSYLWEIWSNASMKWDPNSNEWNCSRLVAWISKLLPGSFCQSVIFWSSPFKMFPHIIFIVRVVLARKVSIIFRCMSNRYLMYEITQKNKTVPPSKHPRSKYPKFKNPYQLNYEKRFNVKVPNILNWCLTFADKY